MKQLTDEEWIARARERVASGGSWQSPPEEIEPLLASAAVAVAVATPSLRCPSCGSTGELEPIDGDGAPSGSWRYCDRCDGVWVARSGLAAPINVDEGAPTALFTTATVHAKCKSCTGYLGPDGACRECGHTAPPLQCPACAVEMKRTPYAGLTLDICPTCGGTWFDVGEVASVYGLRPELTAEDIAAASAAVGLPANPMAGPLGGGGGLIGLVVGLATRVLGR